MIRRDSGDIDGGGDEEQWRPIGREDGEDWQIREFLGKANGWTETQDSGVIDSRDFGLGEERAVAGKFT